MRSIYMIQPKWLYQGAFNISLYSNIRTDKGGIKMISKLKIRDIRKHREITQLELSIMADVSIGYISDIELGKISPTLRMLDKIATALNVPAKDLLDNDYSR